MEDWLERRFFQFNTLPCIILLMTPLLPRTGTAMIQFLLSIFMYPLVFRRVRLMENYILPSFAPHSRSTVETNDAIPIP
jgi:hypothetical protein